MYNRLTEEWKEERKQVFKRDDHLSIYGKRSTGHVSLIHTDR